jgi:hypothetical protein
MAKGRGISASSRNSTRAKERWFQTRSSGRSYRTEAELGSSSLGFRLQAEQRLVAAIHGKRHRVVNMRDLPRSLPLYECGSGTEPQIDMLVALLSSGHVAKRVRVAYIAAASHGQVMCIRLNRAIPSVEPFLNIGRGTPLQRRNSSAYARGVASRAPSALALCVSAPRKHEPLLGDLQQP